MKKILVFFLTFALIVSMTACGGNVGNENSENVFSEDNVIGDDKSEHNQVGNTTESETIDESETDAPSDTEEPINTELSEIIESHVHAYNTKIVKATCTTEGYTLHTCSCKDEYKTDTIKATGHKYGGWNTTKEATETSTGKVERVCSSCNKVETKELAKLPPNHKHDYTMSVVKPTCTTEGYTVYTCSCGDSYTSNETAKAEHKYVNKRVHQTCTTDGYLICICECGDSYIAETVKKYNHDYRVIETEQPTCTRDGYQVFMCWLCEAKYTDNWTPATGHSYEKTTVAATCTVAGKNIEKCGKCGDEKITSIPATGHVETWTETKEANCGNKGYIKTFCKGCEKLVSTTVTPKVGEHVWVEQTLSDAALAYEEAHEGEHTGYAQYLWYGYHTVQACSICKDYDIDTITSIYTDYEIATVMLGYVNDLRREVYGTDEYDMVLDDTLLELAKIRAKELDTNYSHATDTFTNASENIAGGGYHIKSSFHGWEMSSGHYNNMIKKTAKYFAFAVYYTDIAQSGTYHCVQLFWTESQKECYW